ncbi:hypothetical protein HGA91_02670 [candidate division WWE3 bacterium]|nr:hypothetical protein [candidate division WWE3 bacterium]
MKAFRIVLFLTLFMLSVSSVSAESVADTGNTSADPTPITVQINGNVAKDQLSFASYQNISPTPSMEKNEALESGLMPITLFFSGVLTMLLVAGWGMISGIRIL